MNHDILNIIYQYVHLHLFKKELTQTTKYLYKSIHPNIEYVFPKKSYTIGKDLTNKWNLLISVSFHSCIYNTYPFIPKFL